MRYSFLFYFLLLVYPVFSFGQGFSKAEISRFRAQARNVTITRDNWGVPHIDGKTDADAVFGLLYAQCEENFPRVERNYLEMMGRLSEIEGRTHLYEDLEMRLIYDSAAAQLDYQNSPPWFKKLLQAFADGVNYYLYTHPQTKPLLLKRFEPWFALLYTDGSIAPTQDGGLTLQDIRELYKTAGEPVSFSQRSMPSADFEPSGSNGFAIAPSRTASGNAILYINPHVTFYFRSEVQVRSKEGLNAYGAVTWGQFFVYQGFNEHCGWMHTSSYADVADLYEEKTEQQGSRLFYRYDGKLLPVKTKKISIRYSQGDKKGEETFTTYATLHGPVMGSRKGSWLSLQENNRSLKALMQSWLRTKAKGFEDFKRIMNMRSNNSNNTVFADDKGNIAYWHGNFMPERNPRFDYGLPVDGSIPATNWKGIHELDEIVHVYNPATGWIQNCNSTPFTAAGSASPVPSRYPVYMAPDGQNFRAINAARLLESKKSLTIDRVISEIGYSHYLSSFELLLPPLFNAWDALPASDSLKEKLRPAVDSLRAWDMNAREHSIATTLAIEWAYRMDTKAGPLIHPYAATDAVGKVNNMLINTTGNEKLGLLWQTMQDLEKRYGSWRTPWGRVNRYQRPSDGIFSDSQPSLPVGLGPATWGSLPSFAARRMAGTNNRYGVSGNSFIACIEFGKKIKAKTVITGGQSFDPASPHYLDQAQMYIDGKFKEVLFYPEELKGHIERSYHPGE